MDMRSETYVFRIDPNMFNIIPNMTNVMDNQPLKDMKDFKPCKISNTA